MKKGILLLLMMCTINTYAQFSKSYMDKIRKNISDKEVSLTSASQYNMDLFDKFERLHRNYQYASLGSAAASAGLLISYGCMKDKFEIDENGDKKMKGKAKGMIIGGSVLGVFALAFQISAIECKIQSNKYLRLQLTENGTGIAYVF